MATTAILFRDDKPYLSLPCSYYSYEYAYSIRYYCSVRLVSFVSRLFKSEEQNEITLKNTANKKRLYNIVKPFLFAPPTGLEPVTL